MHVHLFRESELSRLDLHSDLVLSIYSFSYKKADPMIGPLTNGRVKARQRSYLIK